jgi:hypothetical protein
MCRLMPRFFSSLSTPSASMADLNIRSSFGVMMTSPGLRMASSAAPSGRSASGFEPLMPRSTKVLSLLDAQDCCPRAVLQTVRRTMQDAPKAPRNSGLERYRKLLRVIGFRRKRVAPGTSSPLRQEQQAPRFGNSGGHRHS